jgi:hypothetical protein
VACHDVASGCRIAAFVCGPAAGGRERAGARAAPRATLVISRTWPSAAIPCRLLGLVCRRRATFSEVGIVVVTPRILPCAPLRSSSAQRSPFARAALTRRERARQRALAARRGGAVRAPASPTHPMEAMVGVEDGGARHALTRHSDHRPLRFRVCPVRPLPLALTERSISKSIWRRASASAEPPARPRAPRRCPHPLDRRALRRREAAVP